MMSETFDLLFRIEPTPSPSSPLRIPHHHNASSSQPAYKTEKLHKKLTNDNNSETKTESRTTAGEGQERGEWNGCVGWLRIRSKKALLIEIIRRITILKTDTEKDQTNPIARCLVAWLPGLRATGQCQSPSLPLTLSPLLYIP